ncbi:MotA/TolQ/ExbB proton channel family protein [Crateriforma conspicua]|uniref:MotA/TolQ/ExbB proton channel domain-containing protein n=1 Tax=Crateriforma conspicua TaxID=2527996 RepID=A0A5C6FU98_9PLAN|nr:hypothetical protein V7x_14900 [Crateriforma conspicua]
MSSPPPPLPQPLSIARSDIERRIGVSPGQGLSANTWLAGVVALALTTIFYACLFPFHDYAIRAVFMDRGPTQYVTVLLGFWCVVSLLVKGNKLRVQRKALRYQVVPENHDFVLSSQTADQLIRNIHAIADLPEKFIVYNRILIAVANLKNLGRVSDVDDILRSIGERDESSQQTSFGTLAGFIWAIPVLGFIGTVLGLAQAIGRFSGLLDSQSDVSSIVSSLKDVTGGLSTAFETTLVALVIALLVQLWITAQRKAEEEFLDDCHEYCLKQIVSRIRILPYEQQRDL